MGAALTRHLVAAYGARHLLLISPRGRVDEATAQLESELSALGAKVAVAACDVADRAALAEVLGKLKRPITAVIHGEGEHPAKPSANAPRPDVFRSVVDGAVNLHQLTKSGDVTAFVMLCTVAGALGLAGSGEQAAANSFLDALARYRRKRELAATFLAVGSTDAPTTASRVGELSTHEFAAMFDVATSAGLAQAVIMRINSAALREQTSSTEVPALLRGLIDVSARLADPGRARPLRLTPAPRGHVTGGAGHLPARPGAHGGRGRARPRPAPTRCRADGVPGARLRLADRGRAAQPARPRRPGCACRATLVFDHPTPAALARTTCAAELLGARTSAAPARLGAVGRRGRADRDRRHGLPLPRRRRARRRTCGGCVADGGDAIAGFPADRGWDLERSTTPTRTGRHDLRPRGRLPARRRRVRRRVLRDLARARRWRWTRSSGCCWRPSWEALERAGIDPTSLRGSRHRRVRRR